MKKNEAIKMIDEKLVDLKNIVSKLKVDTTISKSTRGTQLYARSKERRVLSLLRTTIKAGKDELKLSEADLDTFTLITTLSSERTVQQFEAKEGESIMDLLKRYPKRSMDKIEASLDKLGLKFDSKYNVVKK